MKKFLSTLLGSSAVLLGAGATIAGNLGASPAAQENQDLIVVGSLLSGSGLTSSDLGLYSFSVSNPTQRTLVLQGPVASYGGVAIDGVYYCNTKTSWMGMFNFYDVFAYDLATGERLMDYDEDDVTAYFAQGGMNLDPVSGDAIGIFYDAEMTGRQLALVSYGSDAPSKTILAELSDPNLQFNAFAVDGEGGCWAISSDGDLYSISRESGQCTQVGATGFAPQAISGAVINPANNRMYWALSAADGTGSLIEVNLETGAGTQLAVFPDNAQWNGLYIPEAETNPAAPAECTNLVLEFPTGSLSGALTCTAPSKLYGGEDGSGPLTVTAFVNGVETGSQEAQWGQPVTFALNVSESGAGWYDFMVVPSNSAGKGPRTKLQHVWIGGDTPSAPQPELSYADGKMTVSWPAVDTGTNGGYINPDNVRYTVYDKDTTQLATGLSALSYEINVGTPTTAKAYQYIVRAAIGSDESALGKTNTIALGSVTPPYNAVWTKEGIDAFTILDGNNDGIEWSLYNESPVGISIHYSEDYDMDDWLISPPLALEAGKAYAVSFTTYSMESYYAERIEVKWGNDNTAAAMTQTILEPTLLPNMKDNPFTLTKYICPEQTGRYFIGFHGISDKDKFDLILSEFNVAAPISGSVPAQCTEVSAEADVNGESKATVSFTAPSVALSGQNLTGKVKVDVYRNDTLARTFDNLTPGSKQSFTDVVPESGFTVYRFVPSNSYGEGEAVTASAYVGFHDPVAPSYADISRTGVEGEVALQWGAVIADVNGIPFPEGSVVYDIYPAGGTTRIASGIQGTSYTFMAVGPGQQDMVSYDIRARYGSLLSEPATTANIPVGTPYDGLHETGTFGNYVWGVSSAGGAEWSVMSDSGEGLPSSYDGDGSYFGCVGSEAGDMGVLFSGLVSLENLEFPSLTFATYHIPSQSGAADRNNITVSVKTSDSDEWIEISSKTVSAIAPVAGEWGVATLPLSAYEGEVIQVQFAATCDSYLLTLIDGINIGEGLANNLTLESIKAPSRAVIGSDYAVEVCVSNTGAFEAEDYEIKLYADNELIATRDCGLLLSGAEHMETFIVRMSALAEEPVRLRAEVVYAPDENNDDNFSATVEVSPKASGLPAPGELKGSAGDGGVKLTWSAPALGSSDGESITEDFEDGEAFADNFGGWTFVDKDGGAVGGLSGTTLPGIQAGSTLGSFWVWDSETVSAGGSSMPHSGTKYLFSLFRYDNQQSDDWAISPLLSGKEQTISFWARSYSGSYPEHLQVLVSSDQPDPDQFVLVENGDIASLPNVWTKYEFTLPAGTRYFALRNYAAGAFMLMIDDVTYVPASTGDLTLSGYNIYRDGELMTTLPASATSWTDTGVDKDRTYTYQVTALYAADGESGPSNKLTIKGDGSGVTAVGADAIKVTVGHGEIVIANPEREAVGVFSASGMNIYTGQEAGDIRLSVAPGIYMVRTPSKTLKVRVP